MKICEQLLRSSAKASSTDAIQSPAVRRAGEAVAHQHADVVARVKEGLGALQNGWLGHVGCPC
jgi:hypothetical protein